MESSSSSTANGSANSLSSSPPPAKKLRTQSESNGFHQNGNGKIKQVANGDEKNGH